MEESRAAVADSQEVDGEAGWRRVEVDLRLCAWKRTGGRFVARRCKDLISEELAVGMADDHCIEL